MTSRETDILITNICSFVAINPDITVHMLASQRGEEYDEWCWAGRLQMEDCPKIHNKYSLTLLKPAFIFYNMGAHINDTNLTVVEGNSRIMTELLKQFCSLFLAHSDKR